MCSCKKLLRTFVRIGSGWLIEAYSYILTCVVEGIFDNLEISGEKCASSFFRFLPLNNLFLSRTETGTKKIQQLLFFKLYSYSAELTLRCQCSVWLSIIIYFSLGQGKLRKMLIESGDLIPVIPEAVEIPWTKRKSEVLNFLHRGWVTFATFVYDTNVGDIGILIKSSLVVWIRYFISI